MLPRKRVQRRRLFAMVGCAARVCMHTFTCAVGDAVNVECDVLAKYVKRLLEARQEKPVTRLNVARLIEEGF